MSAETPLPTLDNPTIKELAQRPQWVLSAPDKAPLTVRGKPASTTDPATWSTFADCTQAYVNGIGAGLGFVFTDNDPYTGIDLDKCIDDDGRPTEEAAAIVAELASYTEKSPSGRGLHIITKAKLPAGGRKNGRVEMYSTGRYFRMTGALWPDGTETIEERQKEVDALHASEFGDRTGENVSDPPYPHREWNGELPLAVGELAKSSSQIRRYLNRGAPELGYTSESEADLALAGFLFRNGIEQGAIVNALRWRRQNGDGKPKSAQYFERTAEKAQDSTTPPHSNGKDRSVAELAQRSNGDDLKAKFEELAQLSPVEYDRCRKEEAEILGIRMLTLDGEVTMLRPQSTGDESCGTTVLFAEVEPWPSVVDGATLLQNIADAFRRFLALPLFAAETMALWVLHAHALDAAQISPIIAFVSPEKRCGKTTALALLQRVVPRPLPASNITAAALFRSVEKWCPTLLIDEADTFLKHSDELRGILNSGHNKSQANVIRTVGDDHEPRAFKTWAPKAIALIGSLPPTLEDRSIAVSMRRRKSDEKVERIRSDRDHGLGTLRRQCARWVVDNTEALRDEDPELPKTLNDRAADNWRPLLAIADVASGDWPAVARKAAEALTPTEDDESLGTLLLADIRGIFIGRDDPKRISSLALCDALVGLPDQPWSEIQRGGKPLTTNTLARRLKPFGIRPAQRRIGSAGVKGYAREDFTEAFERYLSTDSQATPRPNRNIETSK